MTASSRGTDMTVCHLMTGRKRIGQTDKKTPARQAVRESQINAVKSVRIESLDLDVLMCGSLLLFDLWQDDVEHTVFYLGRDPVLVHIVRQDQCPLEFRV